MMNVVWWLRTMHFTQDVLAAYMSSEFIVCFCFGSTFSLSYFSCVTCCSSRFWWQNISKSL
jgi:hypothetical protein